MTRLRWWALIGIPLVVFALIRYQNGRSGVAEAYASLRLLDDVLKDQNVLYDRASERWEPYISRHMLDVIRDNGTVKWERFVELRNLIVQADWHDKPIGSYSTFTVFTGRIYLEYARRRLGPTIVPMVKENGKWVVDDFPGTYNELE
jgi:hypothetical protein